MMNSIEQVGFTQGGYSEFARSLGRSIERSKYYLYHQRQRAGECPEKDSMRADSIGIVLNFFKDRRDNISFLTLPGPLWIFEKTISDLIYARPRNQRAAVYFTACEKDWTVFSLASLKMPFRNNGNIRMPQKQIMSSAYNCQIVKKDGYTIFHKDIFDYIEQTEHKFDCIWIDTQTPLSYIGYRIKYVKNVFKKSGGIFMLTVLKAREHEDVGDRTQYVCDRLPDFDLIHKIEYQDSIGSPMLHLIFKTKVYDKKSKKIRKYYAPQK